MESVTSKITETKHNDFFVPVPESDQDSPTLDTVSGFSNCSSPLPPEPFEPLYTVKFSGDVLKDGDVIKFTIKSQCAATDETYLVKRQFEDFEWLEHCLITSATIHGLIVPPLPPKPAITSEMAEAKSKKQLGSDTRTILADDFHKSCHQLEQYLEQMLCHRIFGRIDALAKFLTEREAPVRSKVRRGLLTRLSESFESRKGSHKDCEEFFQKERDWVNKYGSYMKDACENFNGMIYSQQRLGAVLSHLATALTLCIGSHDGIGKVSNKLGASFSQGLEVLRYGFENSSYNDEMTLGSYLDLYSRYLEAEKDMLFRRTCLLVEYENANKFMDKAKPNKRESAEQAKLAAEKSFEECSDLARQEIKCFHRQRIQAFQISLAKYAEEQLKVAKEVYQSLENSTELIRQFEIPKNVEGEINEQD